MTLRGVLLGLSAAACALAWPAAAAAQNLGTGRVAAERATLYARCDPGAPSRGIVKRDETVTIEAVNEGWVSVRVDATGERGCLRRAELEPSTAIERAGEARRAREIERARGGSEPAGTARPRSQPSPTGRPLRIAGYGTAGLFTATAKKSFDAILDTHSGLDVGAGAQVAWQAGMLRGLFFQVDVSRFEETGERVFVHEGEVFPLGIPLTVTLSPIEVSGGYRYATLRRLRDGRVVEAPTSYFVGGGVGTLGYKEADVDGDLSERFTAYHVMAGADVRVWSVIHAGGEIRYRWVPDGLGVGGVSDAFNETDLGGTTVRVRVGVAF
jgi:hypothetical protein